jgi:hypothetical protein
MFNVPALIEMNALRTAPRELVGAAALAALEGLVLVGLGVLLIVKTATSHPQSVFGALSGALLALVAAAALIFLAARVVQERRWARTPIVVLQILWLPVGFSLAFQAGRPEYGAPLLVAAIGTLALFATPAARAPFEE